MQRKPYIIQQQQQFDQYEMSTLWLRMEAQNREPQEVPKMPKMVTTLEMKTPLRVCRICGLETNTEAELEQFVRNRPSTHGYLNICKKCQREVSKQNTCRTNEFIKIFRARSLDEIIKCYFCGEEITKLQGQNSDSLAIHSLDNNHGNWNYTNKII